MNESTLDLDRYELDGDSGVSLHGEETLVADARAALSPSQMVEQRLIGILKASPLMLSQMQRRLKPGPR